MFSERLLAEFDGLKGVNARKEVLLEAGLQRATLADLLVDGALDTGRVGGLLKAMQARAKAIKPPVLGVLGEAYVRQALTGWYGAQEDTLTYRCQKGVADGLPYVLEVACGWQGAAAETEEERPRVSLCGYNFAPGLRTPFPQIETLCDDAEIDYDDPVVLFVHLTCPRLDATDKGKTSVVLPVAIAETLTATVPLVTKRWTALKKAMRRAGRRQALEDEQARRQQRPMTVKEAAWEVMTAAYLKASANGTLPANARQIMYVARPLIIELTGHPTPWKHSKYFTQTLLPDFMQEHPAHTAEWDVVFDARGHFREPHTGYELGLGTLEVRQYLRLWTAQMDLRLERLALPRAITTRGPAHRYRYALFVEKEGFDPLLSRTQIAEKYDLALMSTKGMTVTAARQLVEALSRCGVTILVLHDFDKSGFEILDKFTSDTRRYQYTDTPTVIDLGLRLEDGRALGLESEPVAYTSTVDPSGSLARCGATEEECAFLVRRRLDRPHWAGARIELNAMDSQQFVTWVEEKLHDVGVEKFVPERQELEAAYRHQRHKIRVQQALDVAVRDLPAEDEAPAALEREVWALLRDEPTLSWDMALSELAAQAADDAEEEDTEEP